VPPNSGQSAVAAGSAGVAVDSMSSRMVKTSTDRPGFFTMGTER
jgi:hypothetical protein